MEEGGSEREERDEGGNDEVRTQERERERKGKSQWQSPLLLFFPLRNKIGFYITQHHFDNDN
jgi:hypothetical protein